MWEVVKVDLDTAERRIVSDVACNAKKLHCPAQGANGRDIQDTVWRDRAITIFFRNGFGARNLNFKEALLAVAWMKMLRLILVGFHLFTLGARGLGFR